MRLAIGIVAHISRLSTAEWLAKTVDAEYLSVDDGSLGAERNHCRVWRWLSEQPADWVICLEDDALPVPDFRNQLAQVLEVAPTPIVSAYLGKLRPPKYQRAIEGALNRADAEDAHWITSNHLLHAVGVAVRSRLVTDMLNNLPVLPIDLAIARWARAHKYGIAYTVPSLVGHRDKPSLIAHPDGIARTPGRVAWRVGTRDHWTSASVPL